MRDTFLFDTVIGSRVEIESSRSERHIDITFSWNSEVDSDGKSPVENYSVGFNDVYFMLGGTFDVLKAAALGS